MKNREQAGSYTGVIADRHNPDGRTYPPRAMIRDRGWRMVNQVSMWPNTVGLLGTSAMQIEHNIQTQLHPVVLEVGAGEAKALAELKDYYPHIYPIALDLSPAHHNAHIADVTANAVDIPLPDESVDVAYSVMAFCYVPDKIRALNEIWRVLRPGGFAAIELGGDTGVSPDLGECIARAHLEETFPLRLSAYNELSANSRHAVVQVVKYPGAASPDWGLQYVGSRPAELGECLPHGAAIGFYEPIDFTQQI